MSDQEREKRLAEKVGFEIQRGYGNEDWVVYPSGDKHPFGNKGEAMAIWAECLRLMAQAEEAERLREALEKMISPEMDWPDGEIGAGHKFRALARKALAGE